MRILAIRYSGLGDVVMLLQTLEKLKNKYENCHITLLTDKSNISLKDISCGMIDEVISLDRSVFRKRKYFLSLVEIVKLFPKIIKHIFTIFARINPAINAKIFRIIGCIIFKFSFNFLSSKPIAIKKLLYFDYVL